MEGHWNKHGPASARALAVLLILVGPLSGPARAGDSESSAAATGYLRCPECGLELPAADDGRRIFCPRCGQKKIVMEFSSSARGKDEGPAPPGRFPMILGGVVAVLAAALAILRRVQASHESRSQAEAQEEAAPDAAQREEAVRWHDELKRRIRRDRIHGD